MAPDAQRFVASLLASPSACSPNRCISDFAIAPSKFLAPLGTSDMPRTLSEIKMALGNSYNTYKDKKINNQITFLINRFNYRIARG